jgi:hypothetical protein
MFGKATVDTAQLVSHDKALAWGLPRPPERFFRIATGHPGTGRLAFFLVLEFC